VMITIVVNIMQSGPQVSTHGCDNDNEIYKNKLILCKFVVNITFYLIFLVNL
jgi:hypothetical protein